MRFVVHEHRARRAGLHYDLRIEIGDVLRDWAFRKEPPVERGVKRFGVEQPEHERSWLDFEGEIREGYGAGTMKIWDRGDCEVMEEAGKMGISFHGGKLKGRYVMLSFRGGWLLFRTE